MYVYILFATCRFDSDSMKYDTLLIVHGAPYCAALLCRTTVPHRRSEQALQGAPAFFETADAIMHAHNFAAMTISPSQIFLDRDAQHLAARRARAPRLLLTRIHSQEANLRSSCNTDTGVFQSRSLGKGT